jgi:chaperonin GroES
LGFCPHHSGQLGAPASTAHGLKRPLGRWFALARSGRFDNGGYDDMAIRPLQDRILIKRIQEEEKTKGGIIIPDTAKEKPMEGKVVAVGNGAVLKDGTIRKLEVKKGDTVLFAKYSGSDIKLDGDDHLILREEDVLAIIER